MKTIPLKPLSTNDAHVGRHFPTPELKQFKIDCALMLPGYIKRDLKGKKLDVKYEFGVSSKNADGDNFVKHFQDCVAMKYGFNDRQIYHWDIKKVDVKKGMEYISFEIRLLYEDPKTP